VREVIGGIARHLRPGTTLIEASTIGPQALKEVAALLPGSVAAGGHDPPAGLAGGHEPGAHRAMQIAAQH